MCSNKYNTTTAITVQQRQLHHNSNLYLLLSSSLDLIFPNQPVRSHHSFPLETSHNANMHTQTDINMKLLKVAQLSHKLLL